MRIFSRSTLSRFWRTHRDAEAPLRLWFAQVSRASWNGPADVRATFGSADFVADNRIIFDIKGNSYRLIVKVRYAPLCLVYVRFIGTHAEYDRIDAATVQEDNMIEPIVDESSHKKALKRIEALWDADVGAPEGAELDALATLVEAYERKTFPILPPDPITAIQARAEQLGWSRKDLESVIGSRARVSEVLRGHRSLTLPMIRRIHNMMGIPADLLIAPGPGIRSARPRPQKRQASVASRRA